MIRSEAPILGPKYVGVTNFIRISRKFAIRVLNTSIHGQIERRANGQTDSQA